MSAANQNPETDSFRISQNSDGSYTAEWNKEDPNWSWLNQFTSKELQIIIEQAIKNHQNEL
jgi:hypothetical protein